LQHQKADVVTAIVSDMLVVLAIFVGGKRVARRVSRKKDRLLFTRLCMPSLYQWYECLLFPSCVNIIIYQKRSSATPQPRRGERNIVDRGTWARSVQGMLYVSNPFRPEGLFVGKRDTVIEECTGCDHPKMRIQTKTGATPRGRMSSYTKGHRGSFTPQWRHS
jgi:hypothetical protein